MATRFSSIATKLASLPSLERVIEDEPEQLQYWYEQLVELELPDQLEGVDYAASGFQEIDTIFQSMRLIMQYEHTNAEELKEVAEREAVEMAEKEENWEMERDMLKEEISGLRERITSKAGIDETNEAFRAEIDSLTTENAYLKQLGRERDRELADQTAKAEELSSRLETLEKERGLFVNNQAQLEDTIREMNRRISSKSDVSQKGEWESRKLRQRNEQAVLLSDQLQNVIIQNDQLKIEVDRLTEALENATALIQDSGTKYADFGDQLAFAERSIERLLADNKELKSQLNDKEGQLTERQQHVSSFSKEFHTVLHAKNAQIDQLREVTQKNELEMEELRARLELHQNQDREEELERLRNELVSATGTARKLFGDAMVWEEQDQSGSKVGAVDPLAELRVRLLQMDKQLEVAEQQVALLTQDKTDMLTALEQKDLANARLNAHNQRLRQLAYGEENGEVQRLEKQLEFRDRHLQQLTHTCTLLQVQLQQLQERELNGGPKKGQAPGGRHPKEQPSQTVKSRKIVAGTPQQQSVELEQRVEVAVVEEEASEKLDDETANREHEGEATETVKPPSPTTPPTTTQYYFMKPQVREEVEANAAVLKSLYQEIVKLVQDVESKDKELQQTTKVHQELQSLLTTSKKETSNVQKQLTQLQELVYGEGQQEHTELLLHDKQRADQDQLTIENMELKRLVETVETSGSELERRMAEGTRRLIFLAIQNSRLERRAETEQRLRQAISQEMARLNERLRRWSMGEERKSRHVMAENEVNLMEVARLQNALLHSVPLAEYNRLLKDFKQMVHAQTIAGGRGGISVSSDAGYQSAEDESSQAYQFSISQSSILLCEGRAADELLLKNRQLEELNQVLESQNDFWQSECQKHKVQIEELSAFLTDLENETEMKSMIANIERRFLQALREQFDSVQEQMISEKQLSNLEKQLHKRRREWRLERQHLVNVVANLHTLLRRQIANTSLPISMEQLVAFRKSMETVRQKELLVDSKTIEIEQTSSQLQTKLALAEAARASIEEIVANDYQLQYIQSTLQGYQLNIITLSGEVNKLREQLQKVNKEMVEKVEEVHQLNQQLQTFNFTNVDLDWMVDRHKERLKQENADIILVDKQKQQDKKPAEHTTSRSKSAEIELSSFSSSDSSQAQQEAYIVKPPDSEEPSKAVLIFDNSQQYEGQIKAIKEAAKLCVQNYQEQIQQKEHAIQEYKALIEGLQTRTGEDTYFKEAVQQQLSGDTSRLRTSADIINNIQLEEKERRIVGLEHQIRRLEEANAELGEQLNSQAADGCTQIVLKHVGIQTNIPEPTTPNQQSPAGNAQKENNSDQHQQYDEEEASGIESSSNSNHGDEEEASDSGTVGDIEDKRSKKNPSRSNSTESMDRRSSGDTHTLRPATSTGLTAASAGAVGPETLLLRHHNETRRLRLKIVALDKRNRQLMDENVAYRERTKFSSAHKPLDPDSEISLLKKDNDRLLRENKNLGISLRNQKEELDGLEKKLKKSDTSVQSKISSELWEERKRHSQAIATLKQRISQLETEEKELNGRISRRDKLIEQLNKDNSSRYVDTDRLNTLLKEWRQERALLEKKERELRTELEVSVERHKNVNHRLEMLAKENKSLKIRVGRLQEKLSQSEAEKCVRPAVRHKEVQTPDEFDFSFDDMSKLRLGMKAVQGPISPQLTPTKNYGQGGLQPASRQDESIHWEEHKGTRKQLRRAELQQLETTEQLNTLKSSYDELLTNYNAILRLDSKRHRQNITTDGKEIAALVVLKDKLLAKDHEIETQRRKIVELEKRLWRLELV